MLIDPDTSLLGTLRAVYVGTDIGVYRMTDNGSGLWQPYASGMPLVPVMDLVYNARRLVRGRRG